MSAGPPRRAVLRWTTRLFRREWRQLLLVIALMTVAVATAVAAATLATNASAATNAGFGAADSRAQLDACDAAVAARQVAAARQRWGDVDVISHRSVAVPGSAQPLDLRGQDPVGTF